MSADAVQAQQQQVKVAKPHHSLPALAARTSRCAAQSQLHAKSRFAQTPLTAYDLVSLDKTVSMDAIAYSVCQEKLHVQDKEAGHGIQAAYRVTGGSQCLQQAARKVQKRLTWEAEVVRAKFLGEGRSDTGIWHPRPHPAVWRESTGGILPVYG